MEHPIRDKLIWSPEIVYLAVKVVKLDNKKQFTIIFNRVALINVLEQTARYL